MAEDAGLNLHSLRVDLVGSMLRPQTLKEAFAKYGRGELNDEELRGAQDEAIHDLVREQIAHHLPIIVDGEFRRTSFMESFSVVAGVEDWQTGVKTYHETLARENIADSTSHKGQDPILLNRKRVSQKLKLLRNQLLDDYRFAQGLTDQPVKVTLISPDRIQQCFDGQASRSVYATAEEFLKDVVAVERQMIAQLCDAGCRYMGIDGPGYTAYVDGPSLEAMRARGEDPMATMERSIAADNQVMAGFPDVTFGIHICRGNRQSMWHREGHYDAIAERLFNGLDHQRLLLEYDTERAGGFEPLRFVPKGKIAVLGVITTKVPRVETIDELRRRIDEAACYLPLEQLAISPQCGFASSIRGNLLSEDDQFRKLDVMLETAAKVWG
ncbi:MAG: methionine synthase [Deltaproteobacteria bacterium]|nr:methionine synthase [Deltaproteobacteria bacterium]